MTIEATVFELENRVRKLEGSLGDLLRQAEGMGQQVNTMEELLKLIHDKQATSNAMVEALVVALRGWAGSA